ncbi:TPA: hypothetical protein MXV08_004058 [Pseudomonas aeruginosa]|nr:hypothetical protein [Pseudomonas aeruginosa]HCA6578200.1 hypothetical protein [Pseudomonas aeruginosa]HCA6932486.1 hypothetical protein [Pseudomonas aeruginosa]HCA7561304.1 hypothetical protein [Pseudomonas aeruginosa]HCA7573160.1 hypothetical protein [Pseudomonas aeruginosa]
MTVAFTAAKVSALDAVSCLTQDLSLLASGDWLGDDDGCEASLGMVERLNIYLGEHSFPQTPELEAAKQAVKCLGEDFALLASGDWEPDDDSCEASLTMVETLRAFINATDTN